jgi:hypothetical protein
MSADIDAQLVAVERKVPIQIAAIEGLGVGGGRAEGFMKDVEA